MEIAPNLLIEIDEDGVARIQGMIFRVTDIVRVKQTTEMTPEQIVAAVPPLTLAQVYAALAYYYEHQEAVDAELERQRVEREQIRSQLKPRIPPPPGSNGMDQIYGKWPGDETDEQINAALEALS